MKNEILKISSGTQDSNFVETYTYRGISVDIFNDDYGQQFYCTLFGEEVGFGAFNLDYRDDLEYLIDEKLDVITRFPKSPKFHGSCLRWFDNGGHRDIKLTFRQRILKVFLVGNPEMVNFKQLENESEKILAKIIT